MLFFLAHLQGQVLWEPAAQLKGISEQREALMPVGGARPGMLTLYQAAMTERIRRSLKALRVGMSSSHISQFWWGMSILKQ